jgi:hypothetical protein
MPQSLASTISLATSRMKVADAEAKSSLPKTGSQNQPQPPTDESFHSLEMKRLSKDPQNLAHQKSITEGKLMAREFMNEVSTVQHPLHEKSFAKYSDVYNCNAQVAENDFIARAALKNGTSPVEKKNPTYEDTLLKKYKPVDSGVTDLSLKFYTAFVDSMEQKWNRVGYKGDREHCSTFCSKYGLIQNNNIHSLKEFQPHE